MAGHRAMKEAATEAVSLVAETSNRRRFRVMVRCKASPEPSSMSNWLIFQLLALATVPAAYDMARDRGRSTTAWLWMASIFGPLALLVLLVLGKRDCETIRPYPPSNSTK
jgi:hypothetical protein